MQITIDIDPEKIDYDKITEQICERFKDADISEIIEESGVLERTIRNLFWNQLYTKFENYLIKDMGWLGRDDSLPTQKFKNELVEFRNNMFKEKSEEFIDGFIKSLDEESIKEALVKIMPNVMVAAIHDQITGRFLNIGTELRNEAFEDAKGAIRYAFSANGMRPCTPYDRNNLPNTDY